MSGSLFPLIVPYIAPTLHLHCTYITPILHLHCTYIAPTLHLQCSDSGLHLIWDDSYLSCVFIHHPGCLYIAPKITLNCTNKIIAPTLHWMTLHCLEELCIIQDDSAFLRIIMQEWFVIAPNDSACEVSMVWEACLFSLTSMLSYLLFPTPHSNFRQHFVK